MPEVYSEITSLRYQEIDSRLSKPLNVESPDSKARKVKQTYHLLASALVHLGYWRTKGNIPWVDYYSREAERLRRKLRPARRETLRASSGSVRSEIQSWLDAPCVYHFRFQNGRVGEIRKFTLEDCFLIALSDMRRIPEAENELDRLRDEILLYEPETLDAKLLAKRIQRLDAELLKLKREAVEPLEITDGEAFYSSEDIEIRFREERLEVTRELWARGMRVHVPRTS